MPEINPEVLKVFGFWSSILLLKLLAMMPLTARQRIKKNVSKIIIQDNHILYNICIHMLYYVNIFHIKTVIKLLQT